MLRLWAAAAAVWFALSAPSVAEGCGGIYVVEPGDSLSVIANRQYQDARKWTLIHTSNIDLIGPDPDRLFVGLPLRLGCINGLPTGLHAREDRVQTAQTQTALSETAVTKPRVLEARVNLVTAGDFAPFTDQSLPGGGLLAEVVSKAMEASTGPHGFTVHWINDWSSHLDPLMSGGMMDLAFPWYQPDCDGDPDQYRCANFLFSDPMFETLIMLFVSTDSPMPFATDADVVSRTLCRPAGYFTHDLDRADRRWITDGKITLEQPKTVVACFEMLRSGQVDAVAVNEFTGREAIRELGLEAEIEAVQGRPLSIEGLHVLVHKAHPDADALLSIINNGLARIKADGQYQQIVDRHMSALWAGL